MFYEEENVMFEESLIETTQFINGNFEGASRKVISKSTSMEQELRTHTNYSEGDFDCY